MVKKSAISNQELVFYIRSKFKDFNGVTLDFEGNNSILSISELEELLIWLENFDVKKKFYLTICVRSKKLIELQKKLLELYAKHSNFQVVLVAGNKKYLTKEEMVSSYKNNFNKWIEALQIQDKTKLIFIGADKIFSYVNNLLKTYSNTQAVLLNNNDIDNHLRMFDNIFTNKFSLYSLWVKNKESSIQSRNFQEYLLRRGIEKANFFDAIEHFAIIGPDLGMKKMFQNYFLFEIE